MGSIDWTQISIGVACLLVLGGVLIKVLPAFAVKTNVENNDQPLAQVVENNTRAMEQLNTVLQVNFARQEAKIDEVVAYVRRCGQ